MSGSCAQEEASQHTQRLQTSAALTSHVMKSLERLLLWHIRTVVVGPSLDPLQYAYQPQMGVEDAIIFLLHRAYTHLEEAGSTVRVMFFDCSSTFNTIQPALLNRKLLDMQSCHLQKFSDDSAIVGCISRDQEEQYRSVVDRKQRTRLNSVAIRGTEVDIVDSYKYLGVHIGQ
ncbi:hypothetical protein L3Q82_013762 [Scortum barcoo]|uniref:Uncharacterized protein n=1 Tax=Scortum barcoo TaxID=214431 RepID=A0ACB8VV38_9TELE|nr:hypothetical protein L3Q82_013762 [Scortum barcoo]